MNKFIPVLMGAMFTLTGAFAQNTPAMDEANQTIINACRTEKGTYISFKDDKCEYSGCAYVGTNGAVSFKGDNERIVGSCPISEYRNKARNQYKSEIDRRIRELEDAKKEADRIGSGNGGNGSVDVGDLNGDGVVDERDAEEARRRIAGGAASGATSGATAGATSGSGSGVVVGGGSTAAAGAGAGGSERLLCDFLEGDIEILPGALCYKECKPRRKFLGLIGPHLQGEERESCLKCLGRNSHVYNLKPQYKTKYSGGVRIGSGVATARTGVIVCRDSKGNIVSQSSTGSCPTGSAISTAGSGSGVGGTVIVGGGAVGSVAAGSGSGSTIIVGAGGAGGGSVGGIQRPAFCDSNKKKDLEACAEWMRVNARFLCSSSGNASMCMGGADVDISSRYSVTDCVNCGVGARKQSTLSGIAEIVGAIAPPLAQLGSAYFGARAYQKGQEAWAGAAATGFEQCQISQNNYLQYLQTNELPALTPAQQSAMNCNGYSLNQYGGLGSGSLGGWYGAGYTPGFVGGMMGPYGGYNPYGMGGYVGGAVGGIGMTGGMGIAGGMMTGGYVGGYPGMTGGMAGGLVNGISIAGGINAGMTGGYMAGGYMNGGYVGGYPGMAGGMGIAGGYMSGGYVGGYPGMTGGIAGGLVNGISIAGGINGGYSGGFINGGYSGGYLAGGYAGGYVAAGQVGGYYPGGVGMAGGYMTAGVAGGYYAAGVAGGYMAGGMAGGMAAGYNPQATNYDRMLQQQGTQYQMGQLMGNMGGGMGYGSGAMYNPMNAGFGLSGSIGFGYGM